MNEELKCDGCPNLAAVREEVGQDHVRFLCLECLIGGAVYAGMRITANYRGEPLDDSRASAVRARDLARAMKVTPL